MAAMVAVFIGETDRTILSGATRKGIATKEKRPDNCTAVTMLIKDLPENERPREKLAEKGAAALSDAEILAVFLGTGRRGMSAVDLGREMIRRFGTLRNLSRASVAEISLIDGIGPAKAAQLAGVFEFGKRLAQEPFTEQAIDSPEQVFALVGSDMQRLTQESVRAILLNSKKRLIKTEEIFKGTGIQCLASPAEVLRTAISLAAHSIILVHNHPSGDPSPSHSDMLLTKKMRKACEAIEIKLADHIIIGIPSDSRPEAYYSFRESGLL